MQVKAKANWQQSFFHKNALQGFSLKGLLLRGFIYSGVLINLILPLYDFNSHDLWGKSNHEKKLRSLIYGKQQISILSRAQLAYYTEKGYLSDSIEELGVGIRDTKTYSYRILSPMVPAQELKEPVLPTRAPKIVFMLAQAKNPYYKSYIGVVYPTQKGINQGKSETLLNSAICEIDSWTPLPSTLPTIKAGEIQCPPGASRVE